MRPGQHKSGQLFELRIARVVVSPHRQEDRLSDPNVRAICYTRSFPQLRWPIDGLPSSRESGGHYTVHEKLQSIAATDIVRNA